jgi:hypothetical protein
MHTVTKFVSALFVCNKWLEFNETLWKLSIIREDAHDGSDLQQRCMALDKLCSMHIVPNFVSAVFVATNGWTSTKTLWEPSLPELDTHIVAFFRSEPST